MSAPPPAAAGWATSTDHARLRSAFACFPSGVAAICAVLDARPVGMVASSFTSVSLDPPLVSICVNRTSTTWPILRRASRLGVSVLAEDHGQVARALAGRSGDRFDKMQWEAMPSDAVLVHGSTLWLECRLERTMTAGDHDIVLLEVHGLRTDPDVSPLVFHGSSFRRLGPTA